jgi:IBR domain, a half RING-finger domain
VTLSSELVPHYLDHFQLTIICLQLNPGPIEAPIFQLECVVCMSMFGAGEVLQLPGCHCFYCIDCLTQVFKLALSEDTACPATCHKIRIPLSLLIKQEANPLLPSDISLYKARATERTTPNPTYCSRPECSAFIPPRSMHHPDKATCRKCRAKTCRHCRKPFHNGTCKEDEEVNRLLELGKGKGWRRCEKCKALVERMDGCLHMTCRCKAEFCYACGKAWGHCQGTCPR